MSLIPARPAPRAVALTVAGLTVLAACAGCPDARSVLAPGPPAPVVVIWPSQAAAGAGAAVADAAGFVLPNWPTTQHRNDPISV